MNRTLVRVVALLAAGALASCARQPARPAPKDLLSRHLGGDPATLDPTTTNEENGIVVEEMIFRPLLGIDAASRPVAALARSWSVSADGLTYEFHLDPFAEWEDGSPVTSDDVLFTLERIRDPKVPAFNYRESFSGVTGIETPDASTVRVRFGAPYAERLVSFNLPIVSRAAYGRAKSAADLDRHPSGSGPYRLERWDTNQSIALVRRDNATPAVAPFRRMVFRIVPDPAVRFRAGERGDLDEFRISRDQRPKAEASPAFLAKTRILKVPQPLTAYLLWNVRHPFLADTRVRRALAHAWPREQTARQLYPPDGAALVSGRRCARPRTTPRSRPGSSTRRVGGARPARSAVGADERPRSKSFTPPDSAWTRRSRRSSGRRTQKSASSSRSESSTGPRSPKRRTRASSMRS